jgi:hypothetical protein
LAAEAFWWQSEADPQNKAIDREYYANQRMAVEKGQKALTQNKYAKIELLSYMASCYGSLARFQITRKASYFSAMRAGMKAVRYADEVHKMDPNYYDVYVGLGAYNYFTSNIPAVIRPFALLMGAHRGQKEVGLQQLRTAMEKSRYSRTEAKIVYYVVLLQEKQYTDAFRLLEQIHQEFPDNFVLYNWIADWFKQQQKYAEGAQYFESEVSREGQTGSAMVQHALLKQAELQRAAGQDQAARQTLSRLRAMPGKDNLVESELAGLERRFR